jgi:polysaccharide pyruvyl transferase CsaB
MSRGLRALVSGYYGFGNAGDEAILAGLIQGFRDLAPEAELTVLSGDPPSTTAEHAVLAVPRGFRSTQHQLGLSDVLVSGGGGLLQDVTSWRSPLYYLAILELARRARRPVAFIGQSLGPLRRSWVRALARRALSGVAAAGLRDRPSLDLFRELGLSGEAEVTADLAFLLPTPAEDTVEAARRRAGVESGPFAVVALRPTPADAAGEEAANQLASAIGGACEELGLPAVLVAMQPSQDAPLARRVTAAMPRWLAQ